MPNAIGGTFGRREEAVSFLRRHGFAFKSSGPVGEEIWRSLLGERAVLQPPEYSLSEKWEVAAYWMDSGKTAP